MCVGAGLPRSPAGRPVARAIPRGSFAFSRSPQGLPCTEVTAVSLGALLWVLLTQPNGLFLGKGVV